MSDTRLPGFRYETVYRRGRPVHAPFDAFSRRHPLMPLARRAKIFKSFDALRGFQEALAAEANDLLLEAESREMPRTGESCDTMTGSALLWTGDVQRTGEMAVCTRFFIDISDQELREIVEAAAETKLAEKFLRAGTPLHTGGEVFPSQVVPAIATSRSGRQAVYPMRFGYRVPGMSLVLNARSETAGQRKLFRESWRAHRCIIPASWYFEWAQQAGRPDGHEPPGAPEAADASRSKEKFALQPRGTAITWLCGLYRMEEDLPAFTILTRPAAPGIAWIHPRMPLILPRDRVAAWIDPRSDAGLLTAFALTDLLSEQTGR